MRVCYTWVVESIQKEETKKQRTKETKERKKEQRKKERQNQLSNECVCKALLNYIALHCFTVHHIALYYISGEWMEGYSDGFNRLTCMCLYDA